MKIITRSLEASPSQIEPGRTPYELGEELFAADDSRGSSFSSSASRRREVGALPAEANP